MNADSTDPLGQDEATSPSQPSVANSNRQRWAAIAAVVLVVVVLVGAIAFLGLGQATATDDNELVVKVMPVETMTPEAVKEIEMQRTFTGVIKAARTSNLSFERTGKLKEFVVQEGETVRADQVLAKLDTDHLVEQEKWLLARWEAAKQRYRELENGPRQETIETAKAKMEALGFQADQLQKELNSRKGLQQSGAISLEELQKTESAYQAAMKNHLAAKKQYDELKLGTRDEQKKAQKFVVDEAAARLAEIRVAIKKSSLRAPFAGKIALQFLDEGAVVNPGAAVLRIVESEKLEAWIGVPPSMVDSLVASKQQSLKIQNQQVESELKQVLPEVDARTRTQQLVFELNSASHVVPGQIVRIQCKIKQATEKKNAFWVPTESLVPAARGNWNILVAEKAENGWVVGKREVTILSTEENQTLVHGTLNVGDQIICSGVHRVGTGQPVEPQSR